MTRELQVRGFVVLYLLRWLQQRLAVSLFVLLRPSAVFRAYSLMSLGRHPTLPPLHSTCLAGGLLGQNDTNPCLSQHMAPKKKKGSYHGNLTDQFKKMAAKTSKVTSVTTALPFLKKTPAIAGNKARPSGADCQ